MHKEDDEPIWDFNMRLHCMYYQLHENHRPSLEVTCEWYLNALVTKIVHFIKNKKYLVLAYEEAQQIEKDLQMYHIYLPLSMNLDDNIQYETN
jgi:hypothetical protein